MISLKNLIYPALAVNLLLCASCAKTTPFLEKTTIEKEFVDSFNKNLQLDYPVFANTKIEGKTFWIYISTEKELLTIATASSMGGIMPEKIIKFLDIKCLYENQAFNLNYIFLKYNPEEKNQELDLLKKSESGSGSMLYQDFTDTTIEILQKTYFSIGDIIAKTEDMNFFAICLADIKKGIKITFIIHKLDIEQFLLNMLPSEEFYKRMILKTEGSRDIINDKYGIHLKYTDISLPDFLREQIVNNSRSDISEMEKYQPKTLEALDNLDEVMLKNIYEVTTKYEFQDYLLIEIENNITKEKAILSKSNLLNKFNHSSAFLPL